MAVVGISSRMHVICISPHFQDVAALPLSWANYLLRSNGIINYKLL